MVYRSKLQICIEILCALASNGAMNLMWLRTTVELEKTHLIQHLKLLTNHNLVEKQNLGTNNGVYVVTKRGLTVLKVVSPIIKEAHKIQLRDFKAISGVLTVAGY